MKRIRIDPWEFADHTIQNLYDGDPPGWPTWIKEKLKKREFDLDKYIRIYRDPLGYFFDQPKAEDEYCSKCKRKFKE
jgi:hypothetical protein